MKRNYTIEKGEGICRRSMGKELLAPDEVSQYLNIKRSTLYSWTESGRIPYYRLGRMIRFKKDDIDSWMEGHRKDEVNKKAKEIFKAIKRPKLDIDTMVNKTIAEVQGKDYTSRHGKPDQVKGLRKEAEHGAL